jgi:hypothetical protein
VCLSVGGFRFEWERFILFVSFRQYLLHTFAHILEPIAEYKVRDLFFEIDWNKQAELWQELEADLATKN